MATCPTCGAALSATAAVCTACQADVSLWLARGDEVHGPYTLQGLEEARAERRLAAGDQVKIGDGPWQPLAAVLKSAGLPPVPPPPPVQYASPRPARRDGLQTLITVVVIFAVAVPALAIVAAILFPVFFKAREKAQQSSCLANVRQLSLAMLQYCADNDERLPPRPRTGAATLPFAPDDWRERIHPRVKSRSTFVCPKIRIDDSYQFNEQLYGLRLGSVGPLSETPQLFDKGFLDHSGSPPHNERYNVGYVDGHACLEHPFSGSSASP